MVTLFLQVVVAILGLIFGIVALLVTRGWREPLSPYRTSWLVVGLSFAVGGGSSIIQNAAAVWAFAEGPGSVAWNEYLLWMPSGNYGRALLRVMMAALLLAIAHPHVRGILAARIWSLTLTLYFGSVIAGGVMGWQAAPFHTSAYYPSIAALTTAELVCMLLALFFGLLNRTMDRFLWIVLAIYTVRQALSISSLAALAWLETEGAWAPHPAFVHLFGVIGYLLMGAVAVRCLVLVRRGAEIHGLLEPVAERRISLLG